MLDGRITVENDKQDKHTKTDDGLRPFGSEFLEELPVAEAPYGAATLPTSACTGLQTGGGDDPLPEAKCC
jgi:hypothetical protein